MHQGVDTFRFRKFAVGKHSISRLNKNVCFDNEVSVTFTQEYLPEVVFVTAW